MCVHFILNALSSADKFFDIESVTRSCNARNTFVTRAEHVRVTLSANRCFEKYNLKLSILNTCILGYFYNFTNIQIIGKY